MVYHRKGAAPRGGSFLFAAVLPGRRPSGLFCFRIALVKGRRVF